MSKKKKSPFESPNRFDLEQAIMALWGTVEDIQLIYEHYYEHHESMSVDDMANVLLGLQQLVHMRGQKTFDIFERIVRENPKEITATV